jgi:hypothetical protein
MSVSGVVRREAPLTSVLIGVALGIALAMFKHPIRGSLVIGGSFILAGLMRAAFSDRVAGLLAVRGRTFDSLLLGTLGLVIVAIALSLRHQG